MKNEKKYLYALTRREAHSALDTCNRITADSPENLGISNQQFEACDRAAYALARPAIDTAKKVLVLTALEFDASFQMFYERIRRRRFCSVLLPNRRLENRFARVQKKLREQWLRKN